MTIIKRLISAAAGLLIIGGTISATAVPPRVNARAGGHQSEIQVAQAPTLQDSIDYLKVNLPLIAWNWNVPSPIASQGNQVWSYSAKFYAQDDFYVIETVESEADTGDSFRTVTTESFAFRFGALDPGSDLSKSNSLKEIDFHATDGAAAITHNYSVHITGDHVDNVTNNPQNAMGGPIKIACVNPSDMAVDGAGSVLALRCARAFKRAIELSGGKPSQPPKPDPFATTGGGR